MFKLDFMEEGMYSGASGLWKIKGPFRDWSRYNMFGER